MEVRASHGLSPRRALRLALVVSGRYDLAFTATLENEPVVMFGITPPSILDEVAVPWMLTTAAVEKHPKTFMKESRALFEVFKQSFPRMRNYVDARNTVAVRWLQWLGFSVYYPEPFGPDEMPFHKFEFWG